MNDRPSLPYSDDLAEKVAKATSAIDMDGLLQTLDRLISFKSCDGQETAVQQFMADYFHRQGWDPQVWEIDLPALSQHRSYGAEIERDQAIGVIGRWGSGDGPVLVLNGHTDVVPAGDLHRWSVDPWRATVIDGRVYGRGSADMKGGLCCALFAVQALQDAGIELPGTVKIQSVVGEEDGGLGTLASVLMDPHADGAIVLEPTELMIAPAQAGAISFRITIPGRAAHGALRTEGIDPLEKLELIYSAIKQLERERNKRLRHPLFDPYELPFAICIGRVQAGVWASTVAETLVLEGRYGIGIGEDTQSARSELESAVQVAAQQDSWLRQHPPAVEWWGARFLPAAIPEDHPLVMTLSESYRTCLQAEPTIRGMPYGSDMHLLVREGQIPTVLFGPGDVRQAHAPDEFITIQELHDATRILIDSIMRFCNSPM